MPARAIIGVNSRNLRTLAVDPDVSTSSRRDCRETCIAVAESGIADARRSRLGSRRRVPRVPGRRAADRAAAIPARRCGNCEAAHDAHARQDLRHHAARGRAAGGRARRRGDRLRLLAEQPAVRRAGARARDRRGRCRRSSSPVGVFVDQPVDARDRRRGRSCRSAPCSCTATRSPAALPRGATTGRSRPCR